MKKISGFIGKYMAVIVLVAASLAASAFPNLAMATVPGAIFSVWHNISGAILANILRKKQ